MKIVDMHCDTISRLQKVSVNGKVEVLRQNEGHIDLLRMLDSGSYVQNFALFVSLGESEDPWQKALSLLELYEKEMGQNQDLVAPVYRFADIAENEKRGKMSSLLTVEEGGVCQGELEKLRYLYEKGVRMLTLTWNYPNDLGYPNLDSAKGKIARQTPGMFNAYLNTPDTVNGLTETGRMFVEEMERLGMIPDVSHLSDAGFYDVASCSKKPFVASHSNARAVCPCVRNMTDDMIRTLAEKGGVMGLNFYSGFLVQLPEGVHNPGTIDDVVKHAKHIVNVGGIEVLGIGSDFDGIETHEELVDVKGLEKLYDRMLKAGFTSSQVDKIFAGNVLRVYRECLS